MRPLFDATSCRRALRSVWSLAVAVGLLLSLTLPAPAATDTLDQAQTMSFPWNYQRLELMAQTFTAGTTAAVDRVSLSSDTSYGFAYIAVEIQSVSPGTPATPSGTVLGSTTFSGTLTCCHQFHDFTFNPAVPVTIGTQYAIVVHVYAGYFTWYTSGPFDFYKGGQLFVSCGGCAWFTGSVYGQDFAFKTWVTTSVELAPTPVMTGAPASSPEGTVISLTGAVAGPSAPTTGGYAYAWSVTKNGTPYASGSGSAFSFTPDDEGTFVVTLQATQGGLTGRTSATITGTNVPPTAKITSVTASAPLVLTTQEAVNFSGSFSDPGALDSHVATWNFGDGTSSATNFGPGGSAAVFATHAYSAAGTYTVKLTVADDDGGMGEATVQVKVQTVPQALSSIIDKVQNLTTLNEGQKNSLIAKLNAANAALARGDTTAANNQLNAFLNELQAYLNAGRISSVDSAALRAAVRAVQAALGTYSRFLSWWPLGV